MKRETRVKWNDCEDRDLLEFLYRELNSRDPIRRKHAEECGGFQVWNRYIEKNPDCGRSVHSIQSRFRKHLWTEHDFHYATSFLSAEKLLYLIKNLKQRVKPEQKKWLERRLKCKLVLSSAGFLREYKRDSPQTSQSEVSDSEEEQSDKNHRSRRETTETIAAGSSSTPSSSKTRLEESPAKKRKRAVYDFDDSDDDDDDVDAQAFNSFSSTRRGAPPAKIPRKRTIQTSNASMIRDDDQEDDEGKNENGKKQSGSILFDEEDSFRSFDDDVDENSPTKSPPKATKSPPKAPPKKIPIFELTPSEEVDEMVSSVFFNEMTMRPEGPENWTQPAIVNSLRKREISSEASSDVQLVGIDKKPNPSIGANQGSVQSPSSIDSIPTTPIVVASARRISPKRLRSSKLGQALATVVNEERTENDSITPPKCISSSVNLAETQPLVAKKSNKSTMTEVTSTAFIEPVETKKEMMTTRNDEMGKERQISRDNAQQLRREIEAIAPKIQNEEWTLEMSVEERRKLIEFIMNGIQTMPRKILEKTFQSVMGIEERHFEAANNYPDYLSRMADLMADLKAKAALY